MSEETTVSIPISSSGIILECIFQLDENLEPTGMYRYKSEVEENAKELEYLDDQDEKDLCDKNNYMEGRNGLFLHAKHRDFVKRIWAYCDFHELIQ